MVAFIRITRSRISMATPGHLSGLWLSDIMYNMKFHTSLRNLWTNRHELYTLRLPIRSAINQEQIRSLRFRLTSRLDLTTYPVSTGRSSWPAHWA